LTSDADVLGFVKEQGLAGKANVHVISKGDVIGDNSQPAWKLFYESGGDEPGWNFAGKFVVSKTGEVTQVGKQDDLEDIVDKLL